MASSPSAGPPDLIATAVEVDTLATEDDSTYGDELDSLTTSVISSALDYPNENGRRYHAYRTGRYMMPNDEDEKERLDIMHEMFLTMMDRELFLAPLSDSPRRVLDLGAGSGIWALDFADQFPSAEVTGNDLSRIQPSYAPPNVKFIIDDYEAEWAYGDCRFDFIHGRYLAFSVNNFQGLINQCYDNLAPGGWVEFQDWDGNLYSQDGSIEGTSMKQYFDAIIPAMEKTGKDPSPGPKYERWLQAAGFRDIEVQKFVIPVGAWPKDKRLKYLGIWNLLQSETGYEATAMAVLTREEKWSKEEVSALVAKAKNDTKNRNIHGLLDFYVVYGRKPSG
ncbi:hypothetical protein DTO164E3_5564 [Paecilomyces variotii]|nr:hypothetical protein DTO164E3_5564 [Paecilomyces variotii]KAJ9218566.1 hypothetical protein DTO169C6_9097 [Paecilomyces variotii]KAJ9321048.1 hypothetical protein DTO027B3_7905 [Paecilomyces variotii]KAJ9330350.1 hypothetical protein DTO027B5_7849 [Paecilomyces variotii]KAJ9395075.1 hypothetical protein DTO282F9_7973 [Paecilomyces variotii]